MTDTHDHHQPPEGALPGALGAVLADPDLWEDPEPGLEDAVAGEIGARAGPAGGAPRRRWPGVAAAAAVLAVAGVVAGVAITVGDGPDGSGPDDGGGAPAGVEVALSGTGLAPGAGATALVIDTPLGTRIDLDVDGLGPAPEGSYYEAWMSDGDSRVGVSAGTFHLRGGDGAIELWSGVSLAEYPQLTVTLQEAGETAGSDRVVLVPG